MELIAHEAWPHGQKRVRRRSGLTGLPGFPRIAAPGAGRKPGLDSPAACRYRDFGAKGVACHEGRRRLAAGLVLLAIAVRVAAVLVLQSHRVPRSTYEHGEIAANLLAGRGFADPLPGGGRSDLAAGPASTPRSWPRPMRSAASRRRDRC